MSGPGTELVVRDVVVRAVVVPFRKPLATKDPFIASASIINLDYV